MASECGKFSAQRQRKGAKHTQHSEIFEEQLLDAIGAKSHSRKTNAKVKERTAARDQKYQAAWGSSDLDYDQ